MTHLQPVLLVLLSGSVNPFTRSNSNMDSVQNMTSDASLHDDVSRPSPTSQPPNDMTSNAGFHDDTSRSSPTSQAPVYFPWDNPNNVISLHEQYITFLVLQCGISQLLCWLGIPGNVLNMIVFVKQSLRDRINFLLFSLAVSDTIVLITLLAFRAPCYIQLVDKIMSQNVDLIMSVTLFFVTYMFSAISQVLIAIISVDRCISVTFPLAAKRFQKFCYTAVAVSLTYVFFIGIYVPHFFRFDFIWLKDPSTNHTLVLLNTTSFDAEHHDWLYATARDVNLLAIKPIISVLVVTCSVITSVQVRRARRAREDMTQSKTTSSDGKITRMLLIVSVISVSCAIPEIVIAFTNIFIPELDYYKTYHNVYLICIFITFVALSVNSSANFLIYVVMSSKFRATLIALIPACGKCLKRRATRYEHGDGNTASTHLPSISMTENSVRP
ncbi:hypothetical protein BaRGS_00016322 [Batillaria attramentaria]|uniref:G-protein coupled receptors family 1 profile domain-containing protein n=1 Tax=Batillaria attramentaria TaxID=370345 RepID=A0ABD0KYZ5_9CAEN